MKNILLLGGGGFVGRHLVNALNREQHFKIYIADKVNCNDIEFVKTFAGDAGDTSFLINAIAESKPDIIYYLISDFSVNSMDEYVNAFTTSIINLNNLFRCLKSGTRLVYSGSSAQYGIVPSANQPVTEKTEFNPVSNYGVLKAFEEIQIRQLSKKFNVDMIGARIFNITGPGESERMVGGAFVSQLIKDGNTLEVGNLFPKRDFLDVRDTAHALRVLGIEGKPGNVYNICSGKSISIKEYLNLIIKEIKCSPQIKESSYRINKTEIDDLVGDNNKLKKLGWKAKCSLEQTIKDLVASYRK